MNHCIRKILFDIIHMMSVKRLETWGLIFKAGNAAVVD